MAQLLHLMSNLTPSNSQNPRPAISNSNECNSVKFDLNGDGFIDAQELHACRYGRVGCVISIYDSNHDGYLDFEELEECKKILQRDKYVQYCQNLYFDLDRNGYIDSYELDKCLERHDPTRHREIRAIRAKRKHLNENNEANDTLKKML
jgi:Ca2+-binding EF-hand superfamily protein